MNDLLIYLFSILLVGYISSSYLNTIENDNDKYKSKNNIKLSFIIATIIWCLIGISFCFSLNILKIIALISFILIIIKEIISSLIKLNYFNKEFKIILRNEDYNISNKIKKIMIKESLKNIFIVLGAPLLLIDYLINQVLNYIFK